ncbi:MAG: UDP-N-acetylmuramoyl-tripeptide--D-alanyl-D-alanine ligase [Proteobacteria bacterium]|nr:UDP-N-acetylmuramoyl-tripeptide--D-alanyl-D-alanine ligase [Pseudomonadota bacterium]
MLLSQIATVLSADLLGHDTSYQHVSIDSRAVNPGDLFVAIAGENFDGHDYIEQAKERGAVGAVISKPINSSLPLVIVPDTRVALGKIAAYHRQQFHIPLIALTGSFGKTTVKEMIASILRQCGSVLANVGTLNNDIGVPLTLLQLNSEHRYAVIEVGANHPGEIANLIQLVSPQVAMITMVRPMHVEGFGSIEGVAKAKSEIFQGLSEDGIAVLNADDKFFHLCQQAIGNKKLKTFSMQKDADVTGQLISIDENGKCFIKIKTSEGEIEVHLSLPGEHQFLNALAAATATKSLAIPLSAIKAGLESVEPIKGRMNVHRLNAHGCVVDDTYNAGPDSVKAAINYLERLPGRRILVLGDMKELGPESKKYHEEIGHYAKEKGIESVLTFGDLTRFTSSAFGHDSKHFTERDELIDYLKPLLNSETTILVKGSKSMKMGLVVNALIG